MDLVFGIKSFLKSVTMCAVKNEKKIILWYNLNRDREKWERKRVDWFWDWLHDKSQFVEFGETPYKRVWKPQINFVNSLILNLKQARARICFQLLFYGYKKRNIKHCNTLLLICIIQGFCDLSQVPGKINQMLFLCSINCKALSAVPMG